MSFRVNLPPHQENNTINQFAFDKLGRASTLTPERSSSDLLIALIIIVGLVTIGSLIVADHLFSTSQLPAQLTAIPTLSVLEPDRGIAFASEAYEQLNLVSRAAVVYDTRDETVLFNRAGDEQLPMASITKIMTALVAHELLPLDAPIPITEHASAVDGGGHLTIGETWEMHTLSDYMLITSSNEAAQALAAVAGATIRTREAGHFSESLDRLAFVQRMNARAREIGLQKTFFANATGLDVDMTSSGGYSTALEVAKLVAYVVTHYPHIVDNTNRERTTFSSQEGTRYPARHTNTAMTRIPGLVASKTGFTDLAGGNLAVAYDFGLGRLIVIVVMGSTMDSRFNDTETLIKATRHYFSKQTP